MIRTVKLYGGAVELRLDPIKHIYTVDGKRAYGVTSILSAIAKPALIQWAANKAGEYMAKTIKPGIALDEIQIKELAEAAQLAHRREKESAASIGTLVHDWAEYYIHGDPKPMPINPQARAGVEAFLEWVKRDDVKFIDSERIIYSRTYNIAGTMDIIAIVKGIKRPGDFKTSNGIWPEAGYQLASYRFAFEEEHESKGGLGDGIVINIRKDGVLETKIFDQYQKDWECVLAARTLYLRQLEHDAARRAINSGKL